MILFRPGGLERRRNLEGLKQSAIRGALAILISTPLLIGCGSSGEETSEQRQLNVYLNRDPGGFDTTRQLFNSKANIQTQMAIYETLFDLNTATGEIAPRLALSAVPSEGGRVWTVRLRPGIRFSNGEPLTARAYEVHFERIRRSALAGPIFYSLGAHVVAAKAVDPLTIRFELARATPAFDIMMATPGPAWFGMNAPEYTLRHQDDPDFDFKPVGTGPYMLSDFTTGVGLTMVKNPYYRSPGEQHVERINYRVMGEGLTPYVALKAGDLDVMYAVDELTIMRAQRDPDVDTIIGPPDFQGFRININARSGALADIRVRKALAYGFNREAANKILTQGLAELATDAYGQKSPWYCPEIKYPEYDADRARRLLAQHGAPVQLTLGVMSYHARLAEVLQAMWKDIGVDVQLAVEAPGPSFFQKAASGGYDLWYAPAGSNRNPMLVDLEFTSRNPANPSGIKSARIDAGINAILAATDRASLFDASCRYQQIMAEELPFLRFTFAPNAVIMNKYITGIGPLTSADAEYYKARFANDD